MGRSVPKPDFMTDDAWNSLMAARQRETIRDSSLSHVEAYLQTKGEQGTYVTQGGPTLVLGTTGRKSGEERMSMANFMPLGKKEIPEGDEDLVVVGSIAGLDQPPAWALNLAHTPHGFVQVKDKRWNVNARLIGGKEREELWPRLSAFFPLWGHFQKYCDREFMVFILSPADNAPSSS